MDQPNTNNQQPEKQNNNNSLENNLLSHDPNMIKKEEIFPSQENASQTVTNSSQPQQQASATTLSTPQSQKKVTPKKVVKGKKLGKGFFLGCFGLFAFLFILFIILLVFSLKANPQNSFIPGVSMIEMKSILSSFVNLAFGLFSLVLLIVLVVQIFKRIIAKKEEKEKKRKSLLTTIITGVGLIINIIIWIMIITSIGEIHVVEDETLQGDIMVYQGETNDILKNTTGLTAPIELRFDASNVAKKVEAKSDMTILSYEWDLDGDGKFGDKTGEVVNWLYEDKGKNNGNYEVQMKLTVRNKEGKKQEQAFPTDVTVAYVKPKIVLEVDKTTGEAPLEVKFDASKSVDPDGQNEQALTFEWDIDEDGKFDDGNEPILTYTFNTIGTFPVVLRVVDRDKKFTTQTATIEVTNVKKNTPLANITHSSLTGEAPLKVTLTGEDSKSPNGRIVKYEWDFGDGTFPEKTMSAQHTFVKEGKYTVSLTVTDEKEKQATSSVEVEVGTKKHAPEIIIVSEPTYKETSGKNIIEGDGPLTVTFDASTSKDDDNDIIEYKWDLDGDGVFETLGAKPDTYTFYEEGNSTIKAQVIDSEGNTSEFEMIVSVVYKPFEAIIEAAPSSGAAPLTVSFDGSASRYTEGKVEQYQWDFDDGNPPKMYNAKIQYTFQHIGTYNVKLTVFTDDGKQTSTTKTVYVSEVPLNARFTTNVKNGRAPLNVVFDPSSSTGVIAKYFWDFGDGVVSSERKPTHVFTKPGTYTVVLTIHSKDNITNQYSDQVVVE